MSNKFKLLPTPPVAPFRCIGCFGENKPVVDWNLQLEFYGAVYMCTDCLKEAVIPLGLIPAEKHEGLVKKAEDLQDMIGRVNDFVARIHSDSNRLATDFGAVIDLDSLRVESEPDFINESSKDSDGSIRKPGEDERIVSEGSDGGEQPVSKFAVL